MTSDYHIGKALDLLHDSRHRRTTDAMLAEAQVHATLALHEVLSDVSAKLDRVVGGSNPDEPPRMVDGTYTPTTAACGRRHEGQCVWTSDDPTQWCSVKEGGSS